MHFDLTTGVQLADLVAYVVSWAIRFGSMNRPVREELDDFAVQVRSLRHRSRRFIPDVGDCEVWSFCFVSDERDNSEEDQG